jgi:hypothetical protein
MSGLKVVFDRERLVLGWKTFNCEYLLNLIFGFGPLLVQKMPLHNVLVMIVRLQRRQLKQASCEPESFIRSYETRLGAKQL